MTAINFLGGMQSGPSSAHIDEIHSLDDIMSKETSEVSFGFKLMYEEWKQKILLSDGVSDEQNIDW
ncbi:hypothetical protein [Erwinia tasmaniensis]|uniref:hypothetical protein n=1 Tax=Erwinia tasmaniensis TaxID=338565 RepID=UPI003A4DFF1A